MTRLLRALLALLCLVLPISVAAAPLRVVVTDNYPPYVYRDSNGQLQGYTVDIWHLWEKKTGIPVQLKGMEWAAAQQELLAGKADVIDMLFITPARRALYDFSPPFEDIKTAIYADASITGLHNVRDLKGFLVGVEAGDACAEHLQQLGVTAQRTYPDYAALTHAVSEQDVKIFCLDKDPANFYLYRLGLHHKFVKAFDLYQDHFHRAVRKGDTATLATVMRGMAMITPQEQAQLRERWMGHPVGFAGYVVRLGQAVLALAMLATMLLVWLLSVRKAVRRRTIELEEEKARLRTLVENSPDVIWLKDTEGRYLSCNREGARLLGKPESDIVGHTDADLFPAPRAERSRSEDLRALRTRVPITTEDTVLYPGSGQEHYMEAIRTAVVTPGGDVLGVLGVVRDVTLRRRQEQTIREQEALLSEMSEMASIGAWEFDMETGHVVWTDEVARIHEAPLAGPRNIPKCLSYYHGESSFRVEQALKEAVAGKPCDIELEMVTDLGNHKWVRAICRPIIENGKVVKVRGTMQDVTERRQLEESMRMANLIYQTSYEAIAVTDAANNVVDANPAYLRLTGCDPGEVIGTRPRIFSSDMHDTGFYQRLREELTLRDHWQGEIWDRGPDGQLAARFVNIRVVRNPDGKVYRHVIQFFDITEQKLKDELIWKQTNFDALTSLPNRRLFVDRLDQELKKAQSDESTLGLMFIDLDRFKQINDTFGRATGDRVMLEATRRMRSHLPEAATLARLGGDSFALVMGGVEKRLHLDMTAEALLQALAAPFPLDNGEFAYLTASAGIAVYPEDAAGTEELIKHAEQAMHMAKQEGRARFSYFTRSAQLEAQSKLLLTNDLRHAIARGQLQLFYQPIVEVANGRIRKAEALLRWAHPVHGMISPARFIPLAEESGLIVEIGEWVYQEAIASIQRWQRKFGILIELSVNNSPVQFERAATCRWIDELARTGLPPASLTVEITEGVLLKDAEHVMSCIQRLRETGSKLSIDDFGTGFSSLSYLKQLDVDYLKIDKSFVAHLVDDVDDQALTGAIIDMGHKLGIQTIAEGVETVEQRDLLSGFGCDFIQGYLYSQPVPRDIFEVFLEPEETH